MGKITHTLDFQGQLLCVHTHICECILCVCASQGFVLNISASCGGLHLITLTSEHSGIQ